MAGNMFSIFSSRHPLWQLDQQRHDLIATNKLPSSLAALLQEPYPNPKHDATALPITVIDLETTGLDPKTDHIVSIGWVHIIQGVVKLSTAQHWVIQEPKEKKNPNHQDPTTRSLHHILPEDQEHGIPLQQAMQYFFSSLLSPVLLAHGATIEKRFIEQFCQLQGLPRLPLIWLDTLKIEQNTTHQSGYQKDFRLFALRQHYQLPEYPAHHALMDATATAELFLAQKHRLFNHDIAPIGVLYQKSI